MGSSPAHRALAGLVHGSETLFRPEMAATLYAHEQSAGILTLAQSFHAPAPDAPRWATVAHACATSVGQGEHITAPLQASTSLAQLTDVSPTPAYSRPLALPYPGKAMEDVLPVPDPGAAIMGLDERRAALGVAIAGVLRRLPTISLA